MNAIHTDIIDPRHFRQVLGNYPTGVVAITARGEDGSPLVMIIGSFVSISLDPPLVGFFVDLNSRSQALIRATGRFCVNILAAEQEALCRQIAGGKPERLAGIDWGQSAHGNPVIDGVIATIDCDISQSVALGDHDLVVGQVRHLQIRSQKTPLLFFRGEFGDYFSTAARLLDRLLEWQ